MNAMKIGLTRSAATNCPICGRNFDRFEQALAQNDRNFQCRHCWTRVGHGNVHGHAAAKRLHTSNGNGHSR